VPVQSSSTEDLLIREAVLHYLKDIEDKPER
jgi:hypothetical protein